MLVYFDSNGDMVDKKKKEIICDFFRERRGNLKDTLQLIRNYQNKKKLQDIPLYWLGIDEYIKRIEREVKDAEKYLNIIEKNYGIEIIDSNDKRDISEIQKLIDNVRKKKMKDYKEALKENSFNSLLSNCIIKERLNIVSNKLFGRYYKDFETTDIENFVMETLLKYIVNNRKLNFRKRFNSLQKVKSYLFTTLFRRGEDEILSDLYHEKPNILRKIRRKNEKIKELYNQGIINPADEEIRKALGWNLNAYQDIVNHEKKIKKRWPVFEKVMKKLGKRDDYDFSTNKD